MVAEALRPKRGVRLSVMDSWKGSAPHGDGVRAAWVWFFCGGVSKGVVPPRGRSPRGRGVGIDLIRISLCRFLKTSK